MLIEDCYMPWSKSICRPCQRARGKRAFLESTELALRPFGACWRPRIYFYGRIQSETCFLGHLSPGKEAEGGHWWPSPTSTAGTWHTCPHCSVSALGSGKFSAGLRLGNSGNLSLGTLVRQVFFIPMTPPVSTCWFFMKLFPISYLRFVSLERPRKRS